MLIIRPRTAAALRQFIEENAMARTPHPRYEPDLASSDFYLFGYMTHCLTVQSFGAADELFSASEVISTGIEKSTLDAVFSNGWRDSGDALQPMVSTLKSFKKV
jgi:hypothetical protein